MYALRSTLYALRGWAAPLAIGVALTTAWITSQAIAGYLNQPGLDLIVPTTPVRVATDSTHTIEMRLVNRTSHPVKLHGRRSGCGCLRLSELPELLPAGSEIVLQGTLMTTFANEFTLDVEVYTDSKEYPILARKVPFDVRNN
jgi:hypothetical protein